MSCLRLYRTGMTHKYRGKHLLRRIQNLTTRYFRPAWEENCREGAFLLCNRIRVHPDVPPYARRKFEEGYSYRAIFHEDYAEAKDEFLNLVFGWW